MTKVFRFVVHIQNCFKCTADNIIFLSNSPFTLSSSYFLVFHLQVLEIILLSEDCVLVVHY